MQKHRPRCGLPAALHMCLSKASLVGSPPAEGPQSEGGSGKRPGLATRRSRPCAVHQRAACPWQVAPPLWTQAPLCGLVINRPSADRFQPATGIVDPHPEALSEAISFTQHKTLRLSLVTLERPEVLGAPRQKQNI